MISVIIPSYNSESTIEKCLLSIRAQDCNEPLEIILVDSSTDATPQIINQKFEEITYIHLAVKTDPGTARNLGLEKSNGDLIVFIDSDCEAQAGWLERIITLHRDTEYHAVGGAVCNGDPHKLNIPWAGYMMEFREFIPETEQRELKHIPTCNISYKKAALEKTGKFNADYYPQEDLELNFRFLQNGFKILFDPQIKIFHHHRQKLIPFLKHQLTIGKITSRMLKILPLEGSGIAKNKVISLVLLPLIPTVKWIRTVGIFLKYNRTIIFHHPVSLIIMAIGLVPWTFGFIKGVFQK